jgi:ribosomal protein L16/L10AE
MTTNELNRRIAKIESTRLEILKQMVRDGEGMGAVTGYDRANVKEANAVFELVRREDEARRAAKVAA